ncbi:sensor histidine kinase [Enterocloster sp. OA13]|uniref:sensor histidine kinase n=1 Tax=Enterocloster sp. OA13 TaxID=2914161 RepID=UPI0004719C7A|nr:sensor histidine kinase [Enterocloster sp. OA13]
MDTRLKNNHKIGVLIIVLTVLALSAATIGLYPYMKAKSEEYISDRTVRIQEQGSDYGDLATQVMNFSYEIWHQQKQEEEGGVLSYSQTFLPGLDEKIRTLREEEYGVASSHVIIQDSDMEDGENYEVAMGAQDYVDSEFNLDYYQELQSMMDSLGKDWERYYQRYNSSLFYAVIDENGGFQRSNVNKPGEFFRTPLDSAKKEVGFTVEFTSTGSLKVSGFTGDEQDASKILQAMGRFEFYDPLAVRLSDSYRYSGMQFTGPRNIKIMFRCVPETFTGSSYSTSDNTMLNGRALLYGGGYYTVAGGMMAILMVLALALPAVRSFRLGKSALCRLSFEPLSLIGVGWMSIMGEGGIPSSLIAATLDGTLKQEILRAGFLSWSADIAVLVINLLFWAVVYGLFCWGIMCYRAIFSMGPWRYFKERTWLGRFLRFIKRWCCNALNVFNETDWESRSTRILGKAVIGNFIILTLISCLWFWGIGALVIYSCVLFFMLNKYWGQMQKKYRILLDGINQMAEGDLNVEIEEDLGIFNPFKEQLSKIQNGFKKAVAQEVKSERTKSELITNVSHDLKTPLTAIITYVNLLKQENVTEEERSSYIQVLDQKSMRLKVLIEDLFEVSKASSGTVTLHPENVDIISLLKQVRFELSDKMTASGIEFRFNLPEGRVVLYLDSQKTYRIFENLLVNIAKYGMPGTRAYIQVAREPEGYVNISMRNVSAQELNVSPEELTERFVRGDSARNTEGSGLGLAIARSFVEVQGGTMMVEVEDDLFRVTIRWKENAQEENPGMESPCDPEENQEAGDISPSENNNYETFWNPEDNRIITGEWTETEEDEAGRFTDQPDR